MQIMAKNTQSILIGFSILLYAIGIFILSIYTDQTEILREAPIYSVHGPIENVFFSLMWASLLVWVLFQLYRNKEVKLEPRALVLYVMSVIGFAWVGAYFFIAQLVAMMLVSFSKLRAHNGT